MQTNKQIEHGSNLEKMAQNLIAAAYEYWQEYQKEVGTSAVVWLEDNSGHFILFTRGEYKDSIISRATNETRNEPVMFNPFEIN